MSGIPISLLVLIAIVVLYLLNSIKILRDYERAVIFRLGRALTPPKGPEGPDGFAPEMMPHGRFGGPR